MQGRDKILDCKDVFRNCKWVLKTFVWVDVTSQMTNKQLLKACFEDRKSGWVYLLGEGSLIKDNDVTRAKVEVESH